ncbi:Enzymatic polyprotein [Cucumis melo var. makuwa]|uniref:Enzymatic polyprotein n=1 Tax=Cucumis melo var. makuwa TaxID=1194695 RepID=A0A5A7URD4_CUCMM|nr:Enzymatic polyprotein [Cucumis melo var. makuwa]TYJ96695.1 Enzymatic polyprotein [Cucumis melo var. makuwa]
MKNHYPQPSPPDLGWDDLHHEKHTYDGMSLVTWNIDGYSEAQMMNMFQEMLLAVSAYSARKSTLETTHILILGFTANLRSWWHNQLTEPDRYRILTATKTVVKTENASTPIQVEEPDMVNQCHKMSRYKWYKDTFMARLYTLTTCGADIWKQKFVEGLSHYISKKFYQTVATNSVTKQINWVELTYGDISATLQAICIILYTENKHTTKVIKDSDYCKELRTFCKQYGLNQGPKEEKKKKKKSSSKRLFSRSKAKDPEFPRRKRKYYNKIKGKRHYPSKTNNACFKCNRKGHYANRCPLKDKINALTMDEETRQSILYAIRSDNDTSSETDSSTEEKGINILNNEGSSNEDAFYSQSDSSDDDGAIPCTGMCQQSVEEQNSPKAIQSPIIYSFQDILNRIKGETKKPIQVEDLHLEIKVLKREFADNKQRLTHLEQAFQAFQEIQIPKEAPGTSSTNPDRYSKGKALLIKESGETGSINYISKVQNKKSSGNPLNIQFKLSKVHVCKGEVCLINTFILVKNLNEGIIIGTPFLTQLYPFHVTDKGITSRKFDKEITFEFTHPVTPKYISNIEEEIHQFINHIAIKEKQIEFLQDEVIIERVVAQINQPATQRRIKDFQSKLEKEVSSNIPNAFWDQKRHMVTLPYVDGFEEAQIPTKARPIQMNRDLIRTCIAEINDLLKKSLINPSKSPWSCAAFYVNNQAEKERGVPRLVINYKPLNKVLKWIRYPIPNRQDLLKRITTAKVFSKFDMKPGFWEVQIHPNDCYKTTFNVPFGQYQWNVMPFGLKNAPSEFQKIMNDIFNQY